MKKVQSNIFCGKNPEKPGVHSYIIIPGSGKKTGIPQWECVYCNHKVLAS